MADGMGCRCAAHSQAECGCGVDWTPQELHELWAKYDRLGQLAANLQFYARRYCDGRMTYAVGDLNRMTAELIELGFVPQKDKDTIWAKDGDSNIDSSRVYVDKYGADGIKFIDSIIEKIGKDLNK